MPWVVDVVSIGGAVPWIAITSPRAPELSRNATLTGVVLAALTWMRVCSAVVSP